MIEPGSTLDNGAVVIDIAANMQTGRTYVLAVIPDHGGDPYATWEMLPGGTTVQGSYIANLTQAIADFHDRLGY